MLAFAVTVIAAAVFMLVPTLMDIAEAKGIFLVGAKTANATTTLRYMTPGAATTTVTYDTYKDGLTTMDGGALLVQLTASSSPNTRLNIYQEFSVDGIDWYQSSQPELLGNATTTSSVSLQPVPFMTWTFASSSPGLGNVPTNDNTDSRIIPIQSQTRFTRFIFVLPAGSSNGAVWANIAPVKQNP